MLGRVLNGPARGIYAWKALLSSGYSVLHQLPVPCGLAGISIRQTMCWLLQRFSRAVDVCCRAAVVFLALDIALTHASTQSSICFRL